jgi:nitrite reductase/ring-hydroxylating ferredoxin subunit
MARCEHCGNDYDKSFTVTMGGRAHVFDSFECAIHALAPRCAHCDCAVIGHGVEAAERIFCCANCAKQDGITDLRDRG